MAPNRRQFLNLFAGASVATLFSSPQKLLPATYPYPISSNVYNWITFYGREQKNWGEDLDACMAEYVKSGLTAYEPSFNTPAEVVKLGEVLQKYHIAMPSFYVNSVLHKADEAAASIDNILAIADAAKKLGAKIVVTNPTPIRWGSDEVKSDAELIIQANHLDQLGAALRKKGMTLAYHTHDVELKAGAREFHHMLLQTNPQNVSFCFDVHWVYRGSQNSQLAVFDVLKLYGKRVVELHIRQSNNGIWSETLGEGDIDYLRFAQELKRLNLQPNLVIEQCVEDKTPRTMDAVAAHIKDLAAVKQLFKPILG
jgi:inosose dehydratase